MSDLAIFREKHAFNFKDFTCKKSTIFVIFIFIPNLLVLFFFLPDHQCIIVGNPVTLGCSVQANPMHTTVVWRKMVNGVATDLPASSEQ